MDFNCEPVAHRRLCDACRKAGHMARTYTTYMNLPAQISLITVPQEFTQLCNVLLAAEHGDDYLPIDDDRSDRGNDGYLKSEKRLFAVHCFKRIQNQSIDAAVRSKMVGDLGKAIALKNEGIWDIAAWTFLCNYKVSEAIAARLVALGRDAGISVSWRGPDELAAGLGKHKHLLDQFPELHGPRVSAQLDGIQDALASFGDGRRRRNSRRDYAADALTANRPRAATTLDSQATRVGVSVVCRGAGSECATLGAQGARSRVATRSRIAPAP